MSTQITLGAGIEANHYDRNTNLSQVAHITRSVKKANSTQDIGQDASWMDAHTLTHGEHVFLTHPNPALGEVVIVTTVSPFEGGAGTVRLLFPERDSYDEDFNPVPYAYNTSVHSLMDRMEYDGGWILVKPFERVKTPSCPRCHKFMTVGFDDDDFPFAQCVCGCDIGVHSLMDQDAVIEVF